MSGGSRAKEGLALTALADLELFRLNYTYVDIFSVWCCVDDLPRYVTSLARALGKIRSRAF